MTIYSNNKKFINNQNNDTNPVTIPSFQSVSRLENVFTDIYQNKKWGSIHPNGFGSLTQNALNDISALQTVFKKYNIQSMYDAPCGTFSWIQEALPPSIQYTGIDIVKQQILHNRQHFPQHSFIHADITSFSWSPPKDLIFCKECIQHLSEQDTLRFLQGVTNSQCRYLLITHFDVKHNSEQTVDKPEWDIHNGGYREQNLLLSPYREYLSEPIETFFIRKTFSQHSQYLLLFDLQK